MRPAAVFLPLAAVAAIISGVAFVSVKKPEPPPEPRVKLAVLVVFDQMRGDYLERWRPLFRDDGFARLQREGAWFTHCYYPYGTTTTGPGHASLLTGTCPDVHGIVNNDWIENRSGVYCAGSAKYELVPPPPTFPTEKPRAASKSSGTPDHLRAETVADVLKEAYGKRAKVFGLSLKDRSAILPTGRRPDGAYWFYGVFGTSTYYTERVHPWVAEFNKSKRADAYFRRDWTRFRPDLDYNVWSGPDAMAGEGKGTGQGVTFPHPTTGGKQTLSPEYYDALARSPFGNELLLDFAKTCITAERLGSRDTPDLLVVSFSSNDLIGHAWGPDSHEVLDVTLRSDELMARLLAFLDETVGHGKYIMAVSADHGICPLPEVTNTKPRISDALRVDPAELRKVLNAHLSLTFSANKLTNWVEGSGYPWVHFNPTVLAAAGVSRERAAEEAARFLVTRPGVARAITRRELESPIADSDELARRVKRSYFPARCGDVYVVLKPYCLPYAKLSSGTTHGAPYEYDRHVPLLVYGPGIRGGARSEPTTPQAIANIFAKWLNLRRPKHAEFPIPASLQ